MTKPPKKKAKAKAPSKGKKKPARKAKARKPSKPKKVAPPEPPKDFIGRPLTYTREKADAVLTHMIIGENPVSMREACKLEGIASGTFCGWVVEDFDGLAERYARAQQIRAQILADEIIAISDDGSNDTYKDEEGRVRTDNDVLQRSRLRVDTRKWVLAKALPKIYGDKVQLTGDGGGPVKVESRDLSNLTDAQLEALEQLDR